MTQKVRYYNIKSEILSPFSDERFESCWCEVLACFISKEKYCSS